ncbi:TonB-dependent receptor [Serratia ureilytica]
MAGARESWWPRSPSDTLEEERASDPYGGLIWDFAKDWSWYASYATVFQPRSGKTQERSRCLSRWRAALESGVKTSLMNGALNLSAAAFRIDLENNPQVDPDHPGGGFDTGGQRRQGRSEGLELEGRGLPTPWWDVTLGYTYTDTRCTRDAGNRGRAYNSLTPRRICCGCGAIHLPCISASGASAAASRRRARSAAPMARRRCAQAALSTHGWGYRIDLGPGRRRSTSAPVRRRYYAGLFSPQWNERYGEPRNLIPPSRRVLMNMRVWAACLGSAPWGALPALLLARGWSLGRPARSALRARCFWRCSAASR